MNLHSIVAQFPCQPRDGEHGGVDRRFAPGDHDSGGAALPALATTNEALTVWYGLAGSASNGADYALLPGNITIAAGATSSCSVPSVARRMLSAPGVWIWIASRFA